MSDGGGSEIGEVVHLADVLHLVDLLLDRGRAEGLAGEEPAHDDGGAGDGDGAGDGSHAEAVDEGLLGRFDEALTVGCRAGRPR